MCALFRAQRARLVGRFLSILSLASLSGCAYTTAVPVAPNSPVEGIRIYDVKPILIVNDQSVTVNFIPNYSKPYALQFGAFLAKNDVEVSFEGGFVKQLKSNQDTTAVIDLFKTIAEQAMQPGGVGFAAKSAESGASGRFGIYEFVFDDVGNLVGLRPLLRREDLMILPSLAGTAKSTPEPVPQPGGKTDVPSVPRRRAEERDTH